MKNDRIIAAWNTIEPNDSQDSRMLLTILSANRTAQSRKEKIKSMTHIQRILIPVAACLALLAVVSIVGISQNRFAKSRDANVGAGSETDGTVPGGSLPEGIDPVTSSVAVFPPAECDLADIADATFRQLTEDEAYHYDTLGAHLPNTVIEGYHFRNACVYETVMKDGRRYFMLRVDFTTGDENIADYSIQITGFNPQREESLLTLDAISETPAMHGFFHVQCNGIFVGMDPGDLSFDEILTVLHSIR